VKCPNIWCNDRELKTQNCFNGESYCENCQLRKNYETEFCPTEEEYTPDIFQMMGLSDTSTIDDLPF
jgi:hypothetical protein